MLRPGSAWNQIHLSCWIWIHIMNQDPDPGVHYNYSVKINENLNINFCEKYTNLKDYFIIFFKSITSSIRIQIRIQSFFLVMLDLDPYMINTALSRNPGRIWKRRRPREI